jgi:fucose permease
VRASLHEPVGALGIVLLAGALASAVSSSVTGRLLSRTAPGPILALGTAAVAAALAVEAAAPAMWVIVAGSALFSLGFGAINSALNIYAAGNFGARDINWMHASYGLGATLGPLLVTALLRGGVGWRGAMGTIAAVVAAVAAVLAVTSYRWNDDLKRAATSRSEEISPPSAPREAAPRRWTALVAGITFTTVEIGVESAAGIWGYVFLTSGRGLPDVVAGVVVSAYWAMMFVGRMLLGVLAARLGASRVLAGAVASVPVAALVMAVPGPAFVAAAGMMLLGLATAPIFPLLTLTTGDRVGVGATTAVGLQVAASAVGAAALPSAVGLIIGAVSAWTLAPALLVLSLAMGVVYWLALRTRASATARSEG